MLLAVDNARTVGFAAVRGARLDHLHVSPEARGRGFGGRLLAAAKEASPRGPTLHVFQRNARARAFYGRRGSGLVELRDGSQNEGREPDAVCAWRP